MPLADGGASTWKTGPEISQLAQEYLGVSPPPLQPARQGETAHVFYCQSGVRTTQLIFGMVKAGWPLESLRNYDGSWVEWSHVAEADEIELESSAKSAQQQQQQSEAVVHGPVTALSTCVGVTCAAVVASSLMGRCRTFLVPQ